MLGPARCTVGVAHKQSMSGFLDDCQYFIDTIGKLFQMTFSAAAAD